MDYNLQIQKILVKVDTTKFTDDKIKLLKEAIALADAHNDIEWGFDLRKDLIYAEKETSRCVESMPAFSWMMEACEHHPDTFDEGEIMLEYKWMVAAARRNASVPMQQFETILEDYKARLQRNGCTLHSYYSARAHMDFMLNKLGDARKSLTVREKEEHDDLSFCIACEVHDKTDLEFYEGNIDKALTVGADLFSGKLDCKYIPFQTICNCINILMAKGYTDKAAELFTKADKRLQEMEITDMSNIGYVGELIRYLATVDPEKAWDYFESYVVWSLGCEDYYNLMFSMGVLPLFSKGGTRKLQVSSLIPWYRPDEMYDAQQLYSYYYNTAADLAKRFDERNGNNRFTTMLRELK